MRMKNGLPLHPGEIIKQDILPSDGMSVTAVAKALGCPAIFSTTFWRSAGLGRHVPEGVSSLRQHA